MDGRPGADGTSVVGVSTVPGDGIVTFIFKMSDGSEIVADAEIPKEAESGKEGKSSGQSIIRVRGTAQPLPLGGTTGQVLKKASNNDLDVVWGNEGDATATWGSISGTLSAQTDLQSALDARQPLDGDLTAIAGLGTAAYGRDLLTLADAAAGRVALGISPTTTDNALARFDGTTGLLQNSGILLTDLNYIQADYSNGTVANRSLFQSGTANGNTNVGAIPNGTSTTATLNAFNSNAPDNSGFVSLAITSTSARVNSANLGSGTALPLALATNTIDRMIIRPSSSTSQTTAGQLYQFPASTATDTSGSGTISIVAAFGFAQQTFAASSPITGTRGAMFYCPGPLLAGSNFTNSNSRIWLTNGGTNEFMSTSSGALTLPLYLTNSATATDTSAGLRFTLSTSAGTNSAEVRATRTNRGTSGDTDIGLYTNSGGSAGLRWLLRDDGRVTMTGGSLVFATAGRGLELQSGTGARAGDATLVAGTITVSNTTVTANTKVLLTRKTSGGTIGTAITYTISAGSGFTINSDNILDTSTFTYMLVEVN